MTMLLYSILLLMPFIFRIFFPLLKNKVSKRFYIIAIFFVLFIISAFRGANVGIDTASYRSVYELIRDYGVHAYSRAGKSYEYGYLYLNWFFGQIFPNPQTIIIVFAALNCFAVGLTIDRYSDNPMMSAFLYIMWVFPSSMNTCRQHFAFSIILLGIPFLKEKKILKWVIVSLIATLFHKSAFIFLFMAMIPLIRKKYNEFQTSMIMVGGAAIGLVFIDQLIVLVTKIVPRYYMYFYGKKYGGGSGESLSWFWLSVYLGILIMSLYFLHADMKKNAIQEKGTLLKDRTEYVFFSVLLIMQIIQMIYITNLSSIFSRIAVYSKAGVYLLMPFAIDRICNKYFNRRSRYIIHIVFYIAFIIFGINMIRQDGYRIIPYNFFWNH